jgi:3-oxoadipate enol-lactonase
VTPDLTFTRLAGDAGAGDLLLVGPSLGTSVSALWGSCARLLGDQFEVVGWDLPGHGRGAPATGKFTVANLADAVRRGTADLAAGRPAAYAGVSLGGAVGFELAIEPGPFEAVAAIASAARIGEPDSWHERAELVRRAGTPVMVAGSATRWFAPGFTDRDPDTAGALLGSLADSDRMSYVRACEALAGFDVREALAGTTAPLLIAAGEHDEVIPPAVAEAVADSCPGATFRTLPGCAHLPPAEVPAAVARELHDFFVGREVTR